MLGSYTNLVEIDLLRDGKPIQQVQTGVKTDYRILVSRALKRPKADLYAFNLPNTIPFYPLPLRPTKITCLRSLLQRRSRTFISFCLLFLIVLYFCKKNLKINYEQIIINN